MSGVVRILAKGFESMKRVVEPTGGAFTDSRMLMQPVKKGDLVHRPRDLYQLLRLYYLSCGLYDELFQRVYWRGIVMSDIRALANPVQAAVEFYVSVLWPGGLPNALPIETANDALRRYIEDDLWVASNWDEQKSVFVRDTMNLGDGYLKAVTTDEGRPYIQVVPPEWVTLTEKDSRGFLTFIRTDVEVEPPPGESSSKTWIETEVWEKDFGRIRWITDKKLDTPLEELGPPLDETPWELLGFDFVPYTHAMARNIGEVRGLSPIYPALDVIDELNRLLTKDHDQNFRFNLPHWVLGANMVDETGAPIPAPTLSQLDEDEEVNIDIVDVPEADIDEKFYRMHGVSTISPIKAAVDHGASDVQITRLMGLLENYLLPELRWYRLMELGSGMSGVALERVLGAPVARGREARTSMEAALIRAQQMCVTLGQVQGYEPVMGLGSYESGALAHRFRDRSILAQGLIDLFETERARADAITALVGAGYSREDAMIRLGEAEDFVTKTLEKREDERLAENPFGPAPGVPLTPRERDRGNARRR